MKELFEKIKKVITNPRDFFAGIKKERDFREVITYYLLLVLIVFPIGIITSVLFGLGRSPVVDYITNAVIGIITLFIVVTVYHLFVLVFGGRKGILRTYQAYIYGATPAILVSWMPMVNILAVFYSVYLTIIGLSVLHEMRTARAVLVYFSPLIITLIFATIVSIFAITLGGFA